MNKALFLDLDNTVIKTKSGNKFPVNYDDWEFMPGILTLIRKYHNEGYLIILISNQGGIESGHINQPDFDKKFDNVRNKISEYISAGVSGWYCPFMSDKHYYRKPNPGMAYSAAIALELSLRNSIMVGNSEADAKLAKNAYIGTFYYTDSFLNLNEVDNI